MSKREEIAPNGDKRYISARLHCADALRGVRLERRPLPRDACRLSPQRDESAWRRAQGSFPLCDGRTLLVRSRAAARRQGPPSAAAAARAEGLRDFIARLEEAERQGHFADRINAEAIAHFYTAVAQGLSVQAIDGATLDQLNAIVDMALAAWPRAAAERH